VCGQYDEISTFPRRELTVGLAASEIAFRLYPQDMFQY
jgi:hypothetical protein